MANNRGVDLSMHPNMRRMMEKLQQGCPNPTCPRLPARIESSGRLVPNTGQPDPNANLTARCMGCLCRWEVTPQGMVTNITLPVELGFGSVEEMLAWRQQNKIDITPEGEEQG